MSYRFLEEYAEKSGKTIVDLGEVSRELEVSRLAWRNRDKILMFKMRGTYENIVNYTNLITSRRDLYALFGFGDDESIYKAFTRGFEDTGISSYANFYELFEIVDEIDLWKLPFIKYYREDGGYYLTSSVYVICYGEICNSSFHRTMFIDRDKAVLRIVPRQLHYLASKYFSEGRDAPVAMVLGLHPIQELYAASTPPLGVYELAAAKIFGLNSFAKTPLYGIPVPVNASIVVEGVIKRDLFADEGPFTDILMLVDQVRRQPVFEAKAIYFNNSRPLIHHAIVPGSWEHQFLMGFPREPAIFEAVKKAAPGVKKIRLTEGGSGWLHLLISLKQTSPGEGKLAALAAIAAHPSVKHVFVVDDDIDIDDPLMVEWAIATRMKGGEDVLVIQGVRGSTLDPRSEDGVGDKVVFLALRPFNDDPSKYKRVEVP